MRSAYVALHTSEKLASATKARGWVGIIGKPRAVGARGVHAFFFHGGSVGKEEGTRAYLWRVASTIVFAGVAPPSFASPPSRMWCTISVTCRAKEGTAGKGRKTQHHASGRRFLNLGGGVARAGKASARAGKGRADVPSAPRAGVLEDFVARVLDRPLLERGRIPCGPPRARYRAENKRDAFLKNVKAVAMVIRRVLGRTAACVPPACATREPAPRPDARSRESAKARLCSAHRRARARPREWRSCQIPALRSREKGSPSAGTGEVHARNRVRTGFFARPFRWRFQRVSNSGNVRGFGRRVHRRRMTKQSWNGFSSSTQTPTQETLRIPFFRIIQTPSTLKENAKIKSRKKRKKPFTGFPHES